MPKPRNPVGRPRIHPRYPTPAKPAASAASASAAPRRPAYADDDIEELDDWNSDEVDRDDTVRDRDWVNRQQDDRLPWSKRNHSTVNNYSSGYQRGGGGHAYRNIRPPVSFQDQQSRPAHLNQQQQQQQQRSTSGQFHQTQFVKPEAARKATIPFLQPAFAPNASTSYPRDQPLPRLKPGTVRTRGTPVTSHRSANQ